MLNPRDIWDYRTWSRTFEAFTYGSGRELVVGEGDDLRIMLVGTVAAGFFEFFGYRPALGRSILADDDRPEAPRVAVLSHRTWIDHFGGDPSAVGTTVVIAGEPHEVIGVMPDDFRIETPAESLFLGDADIWTAARLHPATYRGTRIHTIFTGFGRLAPGVSFAEAQAELDEMTERIRALDPDAAAANIRSTVVSLRENVVKDVRPVLVLLLAGVALTLLVACVNAANLLLARGHARGRELAVRTALGAGGSRLFRLVLTESLVLALVGGAAGLALAFVELEVVRALAGDSIPRLDTVSFDYRVLLFAVCISLGTALAAGLVPALRGALGIMLPSSARGGAATPGHPCACATPSS